MHCLALDAMGVIFQSADDVAELLIPFIAEHGGSSNEAAIQSAYLEASLGKISPEAFWMQVSVAPELEDSFLSRHSLNPGILDLLSHASDNAVPVWCLSNDVGRWSSKLRSNLGIDRFLAGSIISGDVGVRKPDREIYDVLVEACGHRAEDLLFVDDREKNVLAAREAGIKSTRFKPEDGFESVSNWIAACTPFAPDTGP